VFLRTAIDRSTPPFPHPPDRDPQFSYAIAGRQVQRGHRFAVAPKNQYAELLAQLPDQGLRLRLALLDVPAREIPNVGVPAARRGAVPEQDLTALYERARDDRMHHRILLTAAAKAARRRVDKSVVVRERAAGRGPHHNPLCRRVIFTVPFDKRLAAKALGPKPPDRFLARGGRGARGTVPGRVFLRRRLSWMRDTRGPGGAEPLGAGAAVPVARAARTAAAGSGTCTGKHALLAQHLQSAGLDALPLLVVGALAPPLWPDLGYLYASTSAASTRLRRRFGFPPDSAWR